MHKTTEVLLNEKILASSTLTQKALAQNSFGSLWERSYTLIEDGSTISNIDWVVFVGVKYKPPSADRFGFIPMKRHRVKGRAFRFNNFNGAVKFAQSFQIVSDEEE